MSNDDMEQPPKHWIYENGEWKYTGPETLEIIFSPPLGLSKDDASAVQSITLVEPTADNLSKFLQAQRSHDDAYASCVFISVNANADLPRIRKIRSRDLTKALEFLQGFTPPDRAPKA